MYKNTWCEPPARAVSPLPLTPEKSQVSNNKETFIVMKDPALNDLPLLALTPEKSQVSINKETFIVKLLHGHQIPIEY
jgi:hypothetical protein